MGKLAKNRADVFRALGFAFGGLGLWGCRVYGVGLQDSRATDLRLLCVWFLGGFGQIRPLIRQS